jgi:hypothetical protein
MRTVLSVKNLTSLQNRKHTARFQRVMLLAAILAAISQALLFFAYPRSTERRSTERRSRLEPRQVPSDRNCWNHFDFGMLEEWDRTSSRFCIAENVSRVGEGINITSWLRCRVQVDAHLPPKTAPHTMCDGTNIILDTNKLSPTGCLQSRPGYKCGPPEIWHTFAAGALTAWCTRTAEFTDDKFPNDHLKDMFASFQATGDESWISSNDVFDLAPVVLVVTRERTEHANLFHATTDFLNMFATLHVAGVIDGAAAGREGLDDVQVLLLDEQRGPFEEAFIRPVFSPKHPILYVSTLKAQGKARVRLRRALFAPPGYSSFMLAKAEAVEEFRVGDSHGYCTSYGGSRLLLAYRGFVLGGLGVADAAAGSRSVEGDGGVGWPAALEPAEAPLRVTFLSRRPYACGSVNHSTIKRQVRAEAPAGGSWQWPRRGSTPGVCFTRARSSVSFSSALSLYLRRSLALSLADSLPGPLYLHPVPSFLCFLSRFCLFLPSHPPHLAYPHHHHHLSLSVRLSSLSHFFPSLQVLNEDEVLAALRAEPGVDVTRRDFACQPPREQAAAVAATEVLVAMHGAALTHSVFLPDGAAVVEISPVLGTWRLFQHLARMRGLAYFEHVNLNRSRPAQGPLHRIRYPARRRSVRFYRQCSSPPPPPSPPPPRQLGRRIN